MVPHSAVRQVCVLKQGDNAKDHRSSYDGRRRVHAGRRLRRLASIPTAQHRRGSRQDGQLLGHRQITCCYRTVRDRSLTPMLEQHESHRMGRYRVLSLGALPRTPPRPFCRVSPGVDLPLHK